MTRLIKKTSMIFLDPRQISLSLSRLFSLIQIPLDSAFGINKLTEGRIISPVDHRCKMMLVFGCGYMRAHKHIDARLDVALSCWKRDKSMLLILSGADRPERSYAETLYMKIYLMAHGVPASHIVCDGCAWDTLLALAHVRSAICDESLLLVSSSYHIKRCIVLGRLMGLDVYGVSDEKTRSLENASNYLRDQVSLYYNIKRILRSREKYKKEKGAFSCLGSFERQACKEKTYICISPKK